MKRSSRIRFSVLATLLSALVPAALAQPAPAPLASPAAELIVRGSLPRTGTLTVEQLANIGSTEGHWMDHSFRGVPLDAVLVHMGFTRGEMGPTMPKSAKAAGWKKVVLATATDGFQALFSCAELMPEMGPTRAFVVWELDGAPLKADEGPFRIIVTTDKDTSRSLYALQTIEVIDVRDRAGTSP